MRRILITGGSGVVGTELQKQISQTPGYESAVIFSTRFDVTDGVRVAEVFASFKPTMVFHLAAKTAVDWCEENEDICYQVNVEGARNVAVEAKRMGATLIYPSTFYVYNTRGRESTRPFDERRDLPEVGGMVGVYSRSKLLGEEAIVGSGIEDYFIVRFGALFGGGEKDKKFVGKVLAKIKAGEKVLRMVNDRMIQPSSVVDTVRNLLELAKTTNYGVYNMVGHGVASYYDYAKEIVRDLGLTEIEVVPISSAEFAESAPRVSNLSVVNGRLGELGLDLMRDWRESLRDYLNELREGGGVIYE